MNAYAALRPSGVAQMLAAFNHIYLTSVGEGNFGFYKCDICPFTVLFYVFRSTFLQRTPSNESCYPIQSL